MNNAVRSVSSANTLVKTKKFNELKASHVDRFREIIGQNGVKTEDLDGFNTDWLKIHKGNRKKPCHCFQKKFVQNFLAKNLKLISYNRFEQVTASWSCYPAAWIN